jgi:hypothetical protein
MSSSMLILDQAKAELAANPGNYTTNQSLLDLAAYETRSLQTHI